MLLGSIKSSRSCAIFSLQSGRHRVKLLLPVSREQEGAGGLGEEETKLKVSYDSVAFQSKCTDEYQVETLETKCAEEQELFATLSRHTSTGCRCVQRMLR